MENNKSLIAVGGVALIAVGAFLIFGRGNSESKSGAEDVVEEAQKSYKEQTTGKDGAINYKGTMGKGEEITVEFMMHDYADVPDDSTFSEMKDSLTPLQGKASFKIKEIGTVDKVSGTKQSGEDATFHYIIYDFKGNADNPDSNTIHPRSFDETGWDPAPQFVTIINSDADYPGSYWEDALLELKGYEDAPFGADFTTAEWFTKAAVWEVDDSDKPIYALKYTNPQNETFYIKVKE